MSGSGEPLLPLVRALWLVLGVQEQSSTAGAASLLRLEKAQVGKPQREVLPASPSGPVVSQGRVIG